MKRLAIATALLITAISAGGFFWPHSSKAQEMNMRVNVKDLAEYGLTLVSLADASFDEKASVFLKGQPQGVVQVIRPLSVILENTGRLAVVSTRLNWEITKTNGMVVNIPVGAVNPPAIVDGGRTKDYSGAVIPPGSTQFVSLIGMAPEGRQVEPLGRHMAFSGSSQSEMEEFKKALAKGDQEEVFKRSSLFKHLSEAASITVSIDGVFFEDGTFAGDNRTGFFELGKASIDAQHDLATEISTALRHGKSPAKVVEQIGDFLKAGMASNPRPGTRTEAPEVSAQGKPAANQADTALGGTTPGSYDYFKRLYARLFLRANEGLGPEGAVARTLELLGKPRKELRRK